MSLDFQLCRRRHLSCDEQEISPRYAFRAYKGNSSTQSNPDNSTKIDDSRTAGSEGSIVLGSGASGSVSVTNISTDGQVLEKAGDAVAKIAQSNADVSNEAVKQVANAAYEAGRVASDAVAANERATYEAGKVALGAATEAARAAERASYEAGQASLKSAQAASAAAEKAAYESAQASKAAAESASRAASDAIAGNESVSKAALSANQSVTRDALLSVDNATNKSLAAVSEANRSLANTTADVLNFRSQDTEMALELVADAQKQANDLIRYTNEQFTAKLASNAGDAPQNTVDNMVKYVTIAGTILGAAALFKSAKKG